MYRTDKQFMKNPATASSRIYIGSLPKTVIADDLEAKFKGHGKILGLVLNSGFAFIQFETDAEAQSAIRTENGSMLNGRKIIVKQAMMDRSKFGPPGNQGPQRMGGPPNQLQNQMQRPEMQRPPPPQMDAPKGPPMNQQMNKQNVPPQKTPPPPTQTPQKMSPPPPPGDEQAGNAQNETQEHEEPQDEAMEDDRPNIRPPGPPQHSDRGRKGGRKGIPHRGLPDRAPRGKSNERNRFHDRYDHPPQNMDMYRDEPYYGRDEYMPSMQRPEPFAPPIMDAPPPEKNDCEIIVVSKALT